MERVASLTDMNAYRTLVRDLRDFVRDRRAATAIIFALSLPALLGLAGLGIDVGVWYQARREMQTAADAAAIAAALEHVRGNEGAPLDAAALVEAERNGFDDDNGELDINNPPSTGAYTADTAAFEAIVTEPQRLYLASVVTDAEITVQVRGVATRQVLGEACVLALHPTVSGGVTFTGSTTANLINCIVAANSRANDAIEIGGNTDLTALSLWTPGGYDPHGNPGVYLQEEPMTHTWPLEDPYASLTIPAFVGCDATGFNDSPTDEQTLSPGVDGYYVLCDGLDVQGTLHLEPGTYYVDGGSFTANATAIIDCPNCTGDAGVTIVMTRAPGNPTSEIGQIDVNGSATVTLRAPTDETEHFAGILFYQDRRADAMVNPNRFNGGSTMSLEGGLYFPSQNLDFNGNNGVGAPTCTQIIASTVTFSGDSSIQNAGCDDSLSPANVYNVHLVE